MPNHCSNRVSFYGDSESEIQKLHEIFSKGLENDDNVNTGSVFGHFIPEPDWANIPLSEADQYEYSFSSARGEVGCLLYTSPSPRDAHESRMPSSA